MKFSCEKFVTLLQFLRFDVIVSDEIMLQEVVKRCNLNIVVTLLGWKVCLTSASASTCHICCMHVLQFIHVMMFVVCNLLTMFVTEST